ncbi:hypothetical protein HF086_008991 [Spodoptera exigua]|uniref:Uncharacterized protein n=1 Tax=Spodoptera exigua TaxID=7107 RepID=A0A922SH24_SPOEX|nr:hypothetical protein HF086_008991 [Spodoptera exigua]
MDGPLPFPREPRRARRSPSANPPAHQTTPNQLIHTRLTLRIDGDKNVLNTVVLWCCCGFFFIICGYGLYRQHTLEQRVLMLEQHFQELRRAAQVEQPALGAGPELSRKERDVGDCICPAG